MRRRIILDAIAPEQVIAGVEDDFHHFTVTVRHCEGMVEAVAGRAVRYPWTTCPGAIDELARFVGTPVGPQILRRRDLPDPLTQCTHLYELALLAIAQAGRGGRRCYDIAVPDRADRTRFPVVTASGEVVRPAEGGDGTTTARVWRDGVLALAWTVEGDVIVAPSGFAGHTIWTVMRHAVPNCDDDGLEAARVLRRGIHVAGGRIFAFQDSPLAAMNPAAAGACYTFQSARAGTAQRVFDAASDFSDYPDLPLAAFPAATADDLIKR